MATFVISPTLGLLHHRIRQERVTTASFNEFLMDLVGAAAPLFPVDERVAIILDNARPHVRATIPAEHQRQFYLRFLPPYSCFLNPTEQANSALKASIKRDLARQDVKEFFDNAAAGNYSYCPPCTLDSVSRCS